MWRRGGRSSRVIAPGRTSQIGLLSPRSNTVCRTTARTRRLRDRQAPHPDRVRVRRTGQSVRMYRPGQSVRSVSPGTSCPGARTSCQCCWVPRAGLWKRLSWGPFAETSPRALRLSMLSSRSRPSVMLPRSYSCSATDPRLAARSLLL